MKISEAAEQSGVTVATFKYYVREGLIPEGERLGANRTEYTQAHVQRARLVRALLVTGRLSINAAREVLAAVDSGTGFGPAFEAAQHALDSARPSDLEASPESRERVEQIIARLGWNTAGNNPGVEAAAQALDGFATAGEPVDDAYLAHYAEAAQRLARADLTALADLAGRGRSDAVVELMVVGTVMGDRLVSGLRRIAQEHESTNERKQDLS